ncbi:MAG TPA: lytic transglycosylase domain-containing protein [bacterium]|nr:lytic transglycosylase domain-containing protein [bacterium]
MATSITTSRSRPFYKNKYVEYRRMYDEARNFSKAMDTAQGGGSNPSTKSLGSKPPSQAPDLPKNDANTKNLANNNPTSTGTNTNPSPYGVKSSEVPPAVNLSGAPGVNVPATGSASERMLNKVKEYDPYIRAAADRYQLPPELIAGVIWQESRGNPRAVSHCGAMGLMQLMPATAAGLGVGNAFDAAQNIDGGAKYLRQMLDKFGGRVDFAVAAYNAGPGNVMKHGGIPPFRETQDYVPKVLGYANSFQVAGAFNNSVPSNAIRA